MYCPNCNNYNSDNAPTCVHCGTPLMIYQQPNYQQVNYQQPNYQQPMGTGSITIRRPKKFLGCLVSYKIYVDGMLIGKVKNGNNGTFPVYLGNHFLKIVCGMGKGEGQIYLDSARPNVILDCPMYMGFWSNKIELNITQYYQ